MNQFKILFSIFIIINIIMVIFVDIIFSFLYSSSTNTKKIERIKSKDPKFASLSEEDIKTLLKIDSLSIMISNTVYTFLCVSFNYIFYIFIKFNI